MILADPRMVVELVPPGKFKAKFASESPKSSGPKGPPSSLPRIKVSGVPKIIDSKLSKAIFSPCNANASNGKVKATANAQHDITNLIIILSYSLKKFDNKKFNH